MSLGDTKEEDTEVDMKDVELNEAEQEKQPMTGGENGDAAAAAGPEKNGSVNVSKVKIPEDGDVKFTGLSKEELLRVAGTPGWVRTRWALLLLFWLGWLGMLAGAVGIVIQAPRCKDLPKMNWWTNGPLYQIGDVRAFTDGQNLKGLEQKLGILGQLKVQGLVIGPIHVAPANEPMSLGFEKISPDAGTMDQFKELLKAAHRKSISVVLDLTPNYLGTGPWFSNVSVTNVAERLKSALVFWLEMGVDGFQLSGVDRVASTVPSLWADIRAIVQNNTENATKRVLIGVTEKNSALEVSDLLVSSGLDLLLSGVLRSGANSAMKWAETVQEWYSSHNQNQLAWNIGGRTEGHLASLVGSTMVKFYQMLLLTLPGTPVFNYGDEIGLVDEDTTFPKMLWDAPETEELNETLREERDQRMSLQSFFKTVSGLRVKERSLLYGDYVPLFNSTAALAYLRVWDQSPRYVAAFNWDREAVTLELAHPALPSQAEVSVSTETSALPPGSLVQLSKLRINPGQAVLLRFPYSP